MSAPKKKKSKTKKCIRLNTWKNKLKRWKIKALDFGIKRLNRIN